MKKDTLMGVWQHLVNAEGYTKGIYEALMQKAIGDPELAIERARVGEALQRIGRMRRDWEYWFVSQEDVEADFKREQGILPFDKRWYTE